jgi:hypothetical protein
MYTLEPRLKLSPRWFAAARLEAGRFLEEHGYPGWWKGWKRSIHALEAGAGFRVDSQMILKASWRVARSGEFYDEPPRTDTVVAVQLSYAFDVNGWLRPGSGR